MSTRPTPPDPHRTDRPSADESATADARPTGELPDAEGVDATSPHGGHDDGPADDVGADTADVDTDATAAPDTDTMAVERDATVNTDTTELDTDMTDERDATVDTGTTVDTDTTELDADVTVGAATTEVDASTTAGDVPSREHSTAGDTSPPDDIPPPTPPGWGDPPPPPRAGPGQPSAADPPTPPPLPPRSGRHRTLDRRSRDRVIAGVAGGIGDYFNIDPAIVRLVFVGLTFFGGAGIPLYALGWLFLPERDTGRSVADGLLNRANVSNRSTGRVILALLVLIVLVNTGGEWLWAALLIGLGILLFRNDGLRGGRAGAGADDAGAGDAGRRPATSSDRPVASTGQPDTSAADRPDAATPTTAGTTIAGPRDAASPADVVASAASSNPYDDAYYEDLLASPPPPQSTDDGWRPTPLTTPPQPPPPPSILGRVTVAAALIVIGAVALLDTLTGFDIPPPRYAALALTVVGVGLLVGARWGRARGLIVLGAIILVNLMIWSVVPQVSTGGIGERRFAPVTVAELQESYNLGIGQLEIDLTKLELDPGQDITVDASTSIGQVEVIVPAGVSVEGNAEAQLGSVDVFGRRDDGTPARATIIDPGDEGAATITLDVSTVMGEVDVRRGAAQDTAPPSVQEGN